jgi:Protein ENHANCED DISEASE RESISTANCE 2, C-terminal
MPSAGSRAAPRVQGQADDELPERLLGTVRLNHVDLNAATDLDTSRELPLHEAPA